MCISEREPWTLSRSLRLRVPMYHRLTPYGKVMGIGSSAVSTLPCSAEGTGQKPSPDVGFSLVCLLVHSGVCEPG